MRHALRNKVSPNTWPWRWEHLSTRIHEIVEERRGITANRAERLTRYFGGDAAAWLALQADHGLKTLATRDDIACKVSPRVTADAQGSANMCSPAQIRRKH